ncbi:hypothetical protein HDU76_000583 [Blyttiomyces sp. JEL0837]|nr:hypothetical protein HDU76_000583 [Blyttiomyces sp. JEL0837]
MSLSITNSKKLNPTLEQHDHFMYEAAQHLNVIKFLLSEIPQVDISKTLQSVVTYASETGSSDTVQFCISTFPEQADVVQFCISTFPEQADVTAAFIKAVEHGQLDIVELLVRLPSGIHISAEYNNKALKIAAERGHFKIVKYLALRDDVDVSLDTWDSVFQMAVEYGDLDLVKFLLRLPSVPVDPSSLDQAIIYASSEGHLDIVKYLSSFPVVDPAADDNDAIISAACAGHLDVVEFLVTLSDRGVDPTATGNEAVRNVAVEEHEDVVKFLVTVPGVELHSLEDVIFRRYFRDRVKAVRIWLRYSVVDASSISERFLLKAIDLEDLGVVKLLVEFPGIDATFDDFAAVRRAAVQESIDIVRYLMSLRGVDTAAMGRKALLAAVSRGKMNVVEMLLRDMDVNASFDNSLALRMAAKMIYQNDAEIARLLLGVDGVDGTAEDNEAFVLAAERGRVDFVQLLLDHVCVGNEFVSMVAKAGADEFVDMFEGQFDWRDDDSTQSVGNENIPRREMALVKLRASYGQL